MEPNSCSARAFLRALVLDFLHSEGCPPEASEQLSRAWGSLPAVPPPRGGHPLLLQWWLQFWRQQRAGSSAGWDGSGDKAHPTAAGPPADACRGKGREPGGDAAEEEKRLSRCVRSPLPRLPSLRMDSGSWAGHDSQGSPAHPGSTAAGGPLTCAAREAVDAAAAACRPPAARPTASASLRSPTYEDRASGGSRALLAPSPPGSPLRRGLGGADAGAAHQQEQAQQDPQQRQQYPQYPVSGAALWDDEELDGDCPLPVIEPPPSPTCSDGSPWEDCRWGGEGPGAAADGEARQAASSSAPVAEGRGSCKSLRAPAGAPHCPRPSSGRGRPRRATALAAQRSFASGGWPGGKGAEGDGEAAGEQLGRAARPRPEPGAYARLAQEHMRGPRGDSAERSRVARVARAPGPGRGRRPFSPAAAAAAAAAVQALQRASRQALLQRQRLAGQAQPAAAGQQPQGQQQEQQQEEQQQAQPPAQAGTTATTAALHQPAPQAQQALQSFPDIPLDLLEPGCLSELFCGEGVDDMAWLPADDPAGAGGGGDGAGPSLADLQAMFDDPLEDPLLPLLPGAACESLQEPPGLP